MKKIVFAVLIFALICGAFTACGKQEEAEQKNYTVKLTIKTLTETICKAETVTIEGVEDDAPTVFDVVCKYLDENEIPYEKDVFAGYDIITSIDGAKEDGDVFWQVLVDGEEPDGRYAALMIADGNDIEFFLGKNLDDTETETETEAKVTVQTAADDYDG